MLHTKLSPGDRENRPGRTHSRGAVTFVLVCQPSDTCHTGSLACTPVVCDRMCSWSVCAESVPFPCPFRTPSPLQYPVAFLCTLYPSSSSTSAIENINILLPTVRSTVHITASTVSNMFRICNALYQYLSPIASQQQQKQLLQQQQQHAIRWPWKLSNVRFPIIVLGEFFQHSDTRTIEHPLRGSIFFG